MPPKFRHESAQCAFLFPVVASACGLLMSCSGGGASSSTTNAPSPYNGGYLQISLSTGVHTSSTDAPAARAADVVVLKRLPSGSYLAITEVTRSQWQLLMGSTPWTSVPATIEAPSANGSLPASNLSQVDAIAFATAVATKSSLPVSLPTAIDYQSAYGAGNEYPWGSGSSSSFAVTRETLTAGVLPVASRTDTYGFYDLVGNIREWTTTASLIGGSWRDNVHASGISKATTSVDPDIRHPSSGMRLAIHP